MKHKLSSSYTARMADMSDLPAIVKVEDRYSRHYTNSPGVSLERQQTEYSTPGFVVENSVRLVEDKNGTVVAVAELWDESDPAVHPYLWMTVDPDHENQGLEAYLLEWAEERAMQVFDRVDPELRVALRSHTNSVVKSLSEAKLAAGMKKIRHSFQMRIEMNEPPPEPVWPAGISLRQYDPERDAREVYQVDEEAFQDHFGFVKEDPEIGFERFMHHLTGDKTYDPSMWYLAVNEEDQIVAICINRRYGMEEKDVGWVATLGVRRAWRRKGIARALLLKSFGEFYKRGKVKVGLGVDAESLTGALDLYKKVGMHVHRQYDLYEKVLREGKDVSVNTLEPTGD
jgi:mycothiol synthase